MNESTFWGCTPRKLFALLETHNKVNTIDEDGNSQNEYSKPKKQKAEKLTLEEALAWAR